MNKKIIILLIVLVSFCAVSHVCAADDADLIVSEDAEVVETQSIDVVDESTLNQEDCDDEADLKGEYWELQNIIDEANDGDIINITENYTCDYVIFINKPVTLVGCNGGGVLKANSSSIEPKPFFDVNATNVTIKGLKFIGGSFKYSGAVVWSKDNGSLINCEFRQNIVTSPEKGIGGALLMLGNNCNLTNCTFIANGARLYGGAVLWNGSGGIISNCEFRENEASDDEMGYGGGALQLWMSDNCLIINCTFINNHCNDYGGAVSIVNSNNDSIVNCKFVGNYIRDGGKSMMVNNTGSRSSKGGGAIWSASAGGMVVDNCSFINNSADTLNGGAILLSKADTIKNSYFEGNVATPSISPGRHLYGACDNIISNTFMLEFKENVLNAVSVNLDKERLEELGNKFIKTLHNSTIEFYGGLVFTYGESASVTVVVLNARITDILVLNHPEAYIEYKNGTLTVSHLNPGTYTLRVVTSAFEDYRAVNGDLTIKVNKAIAAVKTQKVTVAYKKSSYWSVTIVDSRNNKPVANMKLTLKVYTGKKYKTVTLTTNSKGVAKYQTKGLSAATHKIVASGSSVGYSLKSFTSSVKVVKQTALTFKVTKKTLKDGASLSITVKNKKTKKSVNGVKVKLLIYTGSKLTKTIVLKTLTKSGHKGVVGYSTNELKVGTHKTKIMPFDIKYSGSAKSSMKITKGAKRYPDASFKISAKV